MHSVECYGVKVETQKQIAQEACVSAKCAPGECIGFSAHIRDSMTSTGTTLTNSLVMTHRNLSCASLNYSVMVGIA